MTFILFRAVEIFTNNFLLIWNLHTFLEKQIQHHWTYFSPLLYLLLLIMSVTDYHSCTILNKKFNSNDTFLMDRVRLRNSDTLALAGVSFHRDRHKHKTPNATSAQLETRLEDNITLSALNAIQLQIKSAEVVKEERQTFEDKHYELIRMAKEKIRKFHKRDV